MNIWWKQNVAFYIVNEDKNFELPEFTDLPEYITNDTNDSKDRFLMGLIWLDWYSIDKRKE
jgi:hypothetical protein